MQNRRSKWKNQFQKVESSSQFHETVREIFINDEFFKNLSCYQEVPVSALAPGYDNNNHCIDWYIDELGVILELHGEQHYKLTNYGNIPYEKAKTNFLNIQFRDNKKKLALLNAGYEYREISYKTKGKLTASFLKDIILTTKEE